MKIEILGPGCAKCNKLAETAKAAADELGVKYELEKVSDVNLIMGYGVMMTPGLVIDGAVKSVGKVPSIEEIKKMMQ
ncbi:thioredoxin family protein [Desulfobulbus alkaliphilus]|uniref:thioredoxin family protein n=1 Tax=Desulfobulbus alkaliphilus TaxID=869814 RepID=UPI0019663553|nr:thioredoxin family protein [Desulfobulbus alkaliphilus]MBM9535619.1 TM0996/MTH895 family glutaredoxin-like protein [Desulfobulbus alkaliphilus]